MPRFRFESYKDCRLVSAVSQLDITGDEPGKSLPGLQRTDGYCLRKGFDIFSRPMEVTAPWPV